MVSDFKWSQNDCGELIKSSNEARVAGVFLDFLEGAVGTRSDEGVFGLLTALMPGPAACIGLLEGEGRSGPTHAFFDGWCLVWSVDEAR